MKTTCMLFLTLSFVIISSGVIMTKQKNEYEREMLSKQFLQKIQTNEQNPPYRWANEAFIVLQEKYYCGNVDGFPHYRRNIDSHCISLPFSTVISDKQDTFKTSFVQENFNENSTVTQNLNINKDQTIFDRDFWMDGDSVSSLLEYLNILHLTGDNNLFIQEQILKVCENWNLQKMKDILLWDKYDLPDRYGVANDDRLWYSIAFMQLQIAKGRHYRNGLFAQISREIFFFILKNYTNDVCDGGVFWDTDVKYKQTISTELFIDLAIYLHQYYSEQIDSPEKTNSMAQEDKNYLSNELRSYIRIAEQEIQWLRQDLLQSSFFEDGINLQGDQCINETTQWTYNQAVYIKATVFLYQVTKSPEYLSLIEDSIRTIITYQRGDSSSNINTVPFQFFPFQNNNYFIVLQENPLKKCSDSCQTFKGIYFRYLRYAYDYFRQSSNSSLQKLALQIEIYVENNAKYVRTLRREDGTYPLDWNSNIPEENITVTSMTLFIAFDLFALYGYITDLIQSK